MRRGNHFVSGSHALDDATRSLIEKLLQVDDPLPLVIIAKRADVSVRTVVKIKAALAKAEIELGDLS